jgi:asparagine synthase (glutamine-hydrolysing)
MCGISGIISGKNTRQNDLAAMMLAMKHRGPDDQGAFHNELVSLGHNRLSIIDLSAAGHQPMTSRCGRYTIVFNGEVYNYTELKQQLPAAAIAALRSETDTEVVLELWVEKGEAILPLLRGMFAFAIWDHQEKYLVIARDHMGIKPVYYYHNNDELVFASEIKGMLASGMVPHKINNAALEQYLQTGYVLQPDTFISEVFMLPAASFLTYKSGTISINHYWDVTSAPLALPASEQEAIEAVRKLVTSAVNEETISDRPLGVFLSGGLDSTVIVAALRNSGVKQIKTFSVGFDGDSLSEEDDVKEAASFYHTEHTQLQVSDADIIPHIDEYIKAIDQPSVDGLNTWLVSKVTAKHVTVALSGLGGDELFSGYSIDREIISRHRYAPLSKLIRSSRPVWERLPRALSSRLSAYSTWSTPASHYATWGTLFGTKAASLLTRHHITPVAKIFSRIDPGKSFGLLQRISYMHQRGFMLSRLLRDSDAVSMDHSIEVRFPLIDHRISTLTFHLPEQWKIKAVEQTAALRNFEKESSYEKNSVKHLLYQAFKKDLPPSFGKRPKRGFKMPVEKWMKQGLLQDIEQTLSGPNPLLEKEAVLDTLNKWKTQGTGWNKVWALYIFKKWAAANIK